MAAVVMFAATFHGIAEEPTTEAVSGFNAYIGQVEARLDQQHRGPDAFVAREDFARLRKGELIIERITSSAGADLPGALLHHWRGNCVRRGRQGSRF